MIYIFAGYVVLSSLRPLGVMMENHQHTKYVIAVGLNSVMKIQRYKELRNIGQNG